MKTLKEDFVNAWVLGKDLAKRAESAAEAGDEDLAELFQMLATHYSYPVDSLAISPALELLGQHSVEQVFEDRGAGYPRFLEAALAEGR